MLVVAATSGGWGLSASSVFKITAHAIAMKTGEAKDKVFQDQRQILWVTLRRANARAVFRRQAVTTEVSDPQVAAELALADD